MTGEDILRILVTYMKKETKKQKKKPYKTDDEYADPSARVALRLDET